MLYNGTSFNDEWVASMSEDDFALDPCNAYLWPELTMEQREDRLREYYNLVIPADHASRSGRSDGTSAADRYGGFSRTDDDRHGDELPDAEPDADASRINI